MNDTPKTLKWGFTAIIALVVAYFVVPILASLAWSLVSLLVAGIAFVGLAMFLPALGEWAGQGSYWLWSKAIKTNPVVKLWRELKKFGEEIEDLEENIANVAAEEQNVKAELSKQRNVLDADEILQWNEDIGSIAEGRMFLMQQRDELRVLYKDMERDVRKNEANWKIGNALNKAAGAVNKAGKIASGTDGGRVAMDAIQDRLSQGRARLAVIKSRKTAAEVRAAMTIDTTAKFVPEKAQAPAPALTNNPSPSAWPFTATKEQAVVKTNDAKTSTFNEKLLDRI